MVIRLGTQFLSGAIENLIIGEKKNIQTSVGGGMGVGVSGKKRSGPILPITWAGQLIRGLTF